RSGPGQLDLRWINYCCIENRSSWRSRICEGGGAHQIAVRGLIAAAVDRINREGIRTVGCEILCRVARLRLTDGRERVVGGVGQVCDAHAVRQTSGVIG